jgi:exonuclease VII small subunit
VFGNTAPPEALTIASTLFQARDFLLAEQKKDRSMSSYMNTMPPDNLGTLEARVTGQQSALQASNESWLAKKAEKLIRKCEALLKSAVLRVQIFTYQIDCEARRNLEPTSQSDNCHCRECEGKLEHCLGCIPRQHAAGS